MYLFYLDESGDPDGWNDRDNFILAGVAVHEGQVRKLSQAFDCVQRRFFPDIEVPVEFHAYDIHRGKRRFRSQPSETRDALLAEGYNVIARAGFPNLIVFVTAIHVTAATNAFQVLRDCLGDICQRFNAFLARQHNAGHPDKGLLIMDASGRDLRIREIMAEFERAGTPHGYLENIVDVPYFGDSHHTRMLQTADLVAFAAHRYFNHGDDRYLNWILDRVDRPSPIAGRVGLKHIVGLGHRCDCVALH